MLSFQRSEMVVQSSGEQELHRSNEWVLAELYSLEKLYLSDNRIEDISALRNLDFLVKVDLSFNMIESIDALVGLKKLQNVNVMGDPIQKMRAITQLTARGVIVFHDSIFAPSVKTKLV